MASLNSKHRKALAHSIRTHVNGELDFRTAGHHGIPATEYVAQMGEWAERVENGTESAGGYAALRYIACLPYTHPVCDDEATSEEQESLAWFLAGLYIVNGCSQYSPTLTPGNATREVLRLLSL